MCLFNKTSIDILTSSYRKKPKYLVRQALVNSVDPDHMLQIIASDQDLCLLPLIQHFLDRNAVVQIKQLSCANISDFYGISFLPINIAPSLDKWGHSELIYFLFLHENICCGYSLEAPQWGTSNEYNNIGFRGEISKVSMPLCTEKKTTTPI